MNNPEIYILTQNRFNRHLVDVFTDGKKAVIFEAPNGVTEFDQETKYLSNNFLNVFIATKNEQVCSILFETKEKE